MSHDITLSTVVHELFTRLSRGRLHPITKIVVAIIIIPIVDTEQTTQYWFIGSAKIKCCGWIYQGLIGCILPTIGTMNHGLQSIVFAAVTKAVKWINTSGIRALFGIN